MYRLVIFENGGTVQLDKNASAVPTAALNELIVKECIDRNFSAVPTQLRLGKNAEFTAKLQRMPEDGTNVALLYPVSLKYADPEAVVTDVAKIYHSVGSDEKERLEALVDMRLKLFKPASSANNTASNANDNSDSTKLAEPEKPKSKGAAGGAAAASSAALAAAAASKASKSAKSKKTKKKGRTWDGMEANSDSEGENLDFSSSKDADASAAVPTESLNALDLGEKSKQGFVVKELSDELGDILSTPSDSSEKPTKSEPFGFLKRYMGGKKLDQNDLKSVLSAMEDHLVTRNVAKEVAASICDQVGKDLVGTSTSNWTTVKTTVRNSIKRVLQQILTPSTSTDLLAGIRRKLSAKPKHPYVISVVGVNGVGKSTNLGKLGFWFLQNDFKVLVAACDTFRSGAVEQLKVHVQRLQQMKGTRGQIELFDRGYGKDAAVIAKQAVDYAGKNDYDVVLIDTAGRRHNDDRLMSSLEKFGNLANPDKIIMVGEALVGTDSVEQARNFDSAFGKGRGLDFFLISKCDTVGEMLGTLVNVTYATGVPVLFVGVGQQYTDLRTLNVDWAVDKLMS